MVADRDEGSNEELGVERVTGQATDTDVNCQSGVVDKQLISLSQTVRISDQVASLSASASPPGTAFSSAGESASAFSASASASQYVLAN